MRSHLAARGAYRCCLVRGRADGGLAAAPAAASFSTGARCSHTTTARCPRQRRRMLAAAEAPAAVPAQTRALSTTRSRLFLGSFRKPAPRALKEQQVEPGYDVLLQFRASVAEDTRRPARAELAQAFRDFFAHKVQYGKRVNGTQAEWFGRLFAYLGEPSEVGEPSEEGSDGAAAAADRGLSLEDLRTAREALARPPPPPASNMATTTTTTTTTTEHHLALCRALDAEIRRRRAHTPLDFKRHLVVLCQYGASTEAAALLAQHWLPGANTAPGEGARRTSSSRRDKELWVIVLRGLAREGREAELLAEAAAAEAAGLEYMPLFHEIMTTFYARRDDLAGTRTWFEKPIQGGGGGGGRRLPATARTYAELLGLAQRSRTRRPRAGDSEGQAAQAAQATQAWVGATFEALCDANPGKELWDVIFQWAVVARDQGVNEVRRMMETMARHNGQRPNMGPDAATINGLIRAATGKGDVLLAERFAQLGAELGIEADAATFVLLLANRIAAHDLTGAYAAFQQLQSMDCPDEEDAAVLNQYLQTLAGGGGEAAGTKKGGGVGVGGGTARLRDVLDTVEQRQVALEPATVVALCMAFLAADQQLEVIDVLSVHALQFSVEERAVVREAFVAYVVDSRRSTTARAWDAYALLRQYFAETPPASRVRVMDGFFRRRRPDMACYVFGHMRGARDPALRPTAALYVRCLEGLGRHPDARGLQMVHNMLKMDTRVQLDTRLNNALMLAYAASGDRERALDFWHDVDASPEGPSYASLAIVFWVCEGLPFGDAHARAVWAKLQRMEIDVPPAVWDAYGGALAGQGHVGEVQRLIAGMEKSAGYGPTATTLGIACNALPGQSLQAAFAAWAAAEYPALWQQVTKRGCRASVDGLRRYNIAREMRA